MRVLVTGGTGFIGRALCARLAEGGHEAVVLSRSADATVPGAARVVTGLQGLDARDFDAAINLAGASIADARWTEARKKLLLDSRVDTTAALVNWMAGSGRPPGVLLSASAVGYYGEQGDKIVTEDTSPVRGFTHDLCAAWEAEARKAEALGTRVCLVRTGVVLDRDGGALAKMLPAFKLGLGGRLASGQHWFPWIHRDDMVSIYVWLLERSASTGAYNASAPNPVTNAEFTRKLAAALGRPAIFPMPGMALQLLFGEMSEILLASDRMVPKRLLDEGFQFRYPQVGPALKAILG
jgi:uncharacterized protein (TIGR01777 family)